MDENEVQIHPGQIWTHGPYTVAIIVCKVPDVYEDEYMWEVVLYNPIHYHRTHDHRVHCAGHTTTFNAGYIHRHMKYCGTIPSAQGLIEHGIGDMATESMCEYDKYDQS